MLGKAQCRRYWGEFFIVFVNLKGYLWEEEEGGEWRVEEKEKSIEEGVEKKRSASVKQKRGNKRKEAKLLTLTFFSSEGK